jgi:hypothetical protein
MFTRRKDLSIPRSKVTNSVYDRLRPYTVPYTTVYIPYTLRIRPYFAVIHGPVLRSYMSVTVYGEIRRNTEIVYGAFTLVNARISYRIRSYTVVSSRFQKSVARLMYLISLLCFLKLHLLNQNSSHTY